MGRMIWINSSSRVGKTTVWRNNSKVVQNAAVAIIPAVILSDEPCILENVPDISDVSISLKILQEIGAKVESINFSTFRIDLEGIDSFCVPYESARKVRASYYFLGALLGKFGKARVSMPGGVSFGGQTDRIQHLKAFQHWVLNVILIMEWLMLMVSWLEIRFILM